MSHAPGGITNLGDFDDGKRHEKFLQANALYELRITISPGIKLKTDKRYPPIEFPFLDQYTNRKPNLYLSNIMADGLVTVISPKANMDAIEVIKREAWQYEHNFGIKYDLIHVQDEKTS